MCGACRVGSINKISITIERQRQELGRRLIRRALADGPGYSWQTTGQSPVIGTAAALLVPVLLALLGLLLGLESATSGVAMGEWTIVAAALSPLAITAVACGYLVRAGQRSA
ncbi:hypothetical protein [Streptomyces sp. NPDC056291]|uniref:hypothetical protein n=1 Tax=unclassified Streptomyces TaxID=2593676 RepID=UPI0035DF2149